MTSAHGRLAQLVLAGLLIALAAAVTQARPESPGAAAERVVREFNEAISARRLEKALALLGDGGVQFNVRAAHGFSAGSEPAAVTSDLVAQWRAVATVLFASTRAYRREVLAATTHAEGDLAVVWAMIRTTTEHRDATPASSMSFAEAYVLRRAGGEWKIVGMANDRPTR